MDEKKATEILNKYGAIDKSDGGLYSLGWYLAWTTGEEEATLDGTFTIEELEAIVWWIRNKGV